MTFGLESLLWLGLPIIGIPILIHLINLMRHRRVQWAAMEFLLDSQKKNSRWIIIKQLILLLLRMGAIAAVVFMLAQTRLRNELGELLGSSRLHHVVIVDDSLSMGEVVTSPGVFEQAKQAITRLGDEAVEHSSLQMFSLIPFSHAAEDKPPLLREKLVDEDEFQTELAAELSTLEPTQKRIRAGAAIAAVARKLEERPNERRIIYIVSDFRTNDWDDPIDIAETLARLEEQGDQIRFVDCSDAAHGNLAITELAPSGGTRAAGVPMEMKVTVKNFGELPIRDVAVQLMVDGRSDRLEIDEIGGGKSETRKFEVRLYEAGDHQINASLQRRDAIVADNDHFCVVSLPSALPVLIIDADPVARDAMFLSRALNPGGTVKTGISPQIELPDFLTTHDLDEFFGVYLVNVDYLEPEWIEKLENYVEAGGGLGIFLGKLTTRKLLRDQLYKQGQGMLPVPISGAMDLEIGALDAAPDLQVSDHPMFKVFAGERNTFLQSVKIKRYYEVERGWSPPEESRMRVIADLRNGFPLAVEQPFGKGRVVAVLTTVAPDWNNWARNPSFPVAVQEMQSYLASNTAGIEVHTVGTEITQQLDAAAYRDEARVIPPGESELTTQTIDLVQTEDVLEVPLTDTDNAGVYTVRLTTSDGKRDERSFAFNVDTDESNLNKLDGVDLKERIPAVGFEYHKAGEFSFAAELEGFNLTDVFLYLLILVLIVEQVFAYFISYHPPAAAKGGAQ